MRIFDLFEFINSKFGDYCISKFYEYLESKSLLNDSDAQETKVDKKFFMMRIHTQNINNLLILITQITIIVYVSGCCWHIFSCITNQTNRDDEYDSWIINSKWDLHQLEVAD